MVFSSTEFIFLFLPAVIALYYIVPKKHRSILYRNTVLLVSSLLFYAWGEPVFIFVILFYIVINWFAALKIGKYSDKRHRKRYLVFAVFMDVLLIFVFKYLSFAAYNVGLLINKPIDLGIALPVGISFFTFQIMSYVFDVYYKTTAAQKNLFKVALYIALFSQLIAGPIVKYSDVEREINQRNEDAQDFTRGVIRFVLGLGKKVLIANYVAVIADNTFAVSASSLSCTSAWLGAAAYMLQIYFDFSGYSDMAIGMGLMFGFHFKENFNFPYAASSITDFWRRWHISLSSWFRNYVYIPLGGNRVSKKRNFFNLSVVWLLTGIWHGANWTFVLWGIYYLIWLIIEKSTGIAKRPQKGIWRAISHTGTLLIVLFGWVLFRSADINSAVSYIGTMFGFGAGFTDATFAYNIQNGWLVLLVSTVLAFPVMRYINSKLGIELEIFAEGNAKSLRHKRISAAENLLLPLFVLAVFVISVMVAVKATYNPFIYFNF